MKIKFIITCFALLLCASSFGQTQKNKNKPSKPAEETHSATASKAAPKQLLAEVSNIGGYPAFFLCDPLLSYKVVASKGAGINWTSAWTGGLINPSIADKAAKMVKRLAEDCKKENIEFDAVIYSAGKEVSAIKFTNPTEDKLMLAKPKKIAGLYVFMFSAPHDREYKLASEAGGGIKWKSLLTGGLINNSIEEDFSKMVQSVADEAKKTETVLDGVVYSTGKSVDGVVFEK